MSLRTLQAELQLADYRRRVSELYAAVRRSGDDPAAGWQLWRAGRDRLFAEHPQSALSAEQQALFYGLDYFPYDPELRFAVEVVPLEDRPVVQKSLEEDGPLQMRPIGQAGFAYGGRENRLTLFWILGYGGGLFLPFRDATSAKSTYGGGRYLLDTIKGADLGMQGERLILDFNFAYNPSCVYHPRWHCPLPPPENQLDVAVRAGERDYTALLDSR